LAMIDMPLDVLLVDVGFVRKLFEAPTTFLAEAIDIAPYSC